MPQESFEGNVSYSVILFAFVVSQNCLIEHTGVLRIL